MNLTSGDILVANVDSLPLIQHVGIIVFIHSMPYVLHNSPTVKNVFAGNIVCEPLHRFLKGRTVVEFISTYITTDYLLLKAQAVYDSKFDAILWNCETFIEYLTDFNFEAVQAENIRAAVSIGIIGALLAV